MRRFFFLLQITEQLLLNLSWFSWYSMVYQWKYFCVNYYYFWNCRVFLEPHTLSRRSFSFVQSKWIENSDENVQRKKNCTHTNRSKHMHIKWLLHNKEQLQPDSQFGNNQQHRNAKAQNILVTYILFMYKCLAFSLVIFFLLSFVSKMLVGGGVSFVCL